MAHYPSQKQPDPLLQKICDAISHYSSIPKLDRKKTYALYTQGYAFYQQGQYDKAIETFHLLTMQNPLEKTYRKAIASCYQMQPDYEKATESWAICALLDKKDPYPHYHAAECLISLGEKKDALKALKEAKKRLTHKTKEQLEGKIDLLIIGASL